MRRSAVSRRMMIALGSTLIGGSALAQGLSLPATVTAGAPLSIPTSGSGKGTVYIVGPAQALSKEVQLGQQASFPAGALYAAGHYVVVVAGGSNDSGEFDVTPASTAETLGFLAKPSRLPVGIHNGISGTIYVFDAYRNLILTPEMGTLDLSNAGGATFSRSVTTKNGLAWTAMDSAPHESTAKFTAKVGSATSTRVIQQVPGDPCSISISAHPDGRKLLVETAPVKDCGGNPIPDGTIVTFTEAYNSMLSTVDVPLKQGVAKVAMPAVVGAKISAASGVVAGNEIRWGGGR